MSHAGCGCCACLTVGAVTGPVNRPGLSAIQYRVGSYSSFLDAMIRRLTIAAGGSPGANYSLRALTTREFDDPAIALLEAWACVGDILTFYQERIASEGFLRTATERRSIVELGRLVGYRLKPGVSASAYLAYTLDETAKTIIPAGTKAQSIPGVGERPQMFETTEDIDARGTWNAMRPRLSRPQDIRIDNVQSLREIWIEGTTTRIDVHDPVLFAFETAYGLPLYALRRALKTDADRERKRTRIVLEALRPIYLNLAGDVQKQLVKELGKKLVVSKAATDLHDVLQHVLLGTSLEALQELVRSKKLSFKRLDLALAGDAGDVLPVSTPVKAPGIMEVVAPLIKPRGLAPASQWQFSRSLKQSLGERSDYVPRLLSTFYPGLSDSIYTALANNSSGDVPYAQLREVSVFRRRAAVFGYNAPPILFEDRPADDDHNDFQPPPIPAYVRESDRLLHLDTPDEAVTVGSYVLTHNPRGTTITRVLDAETMPHTAYGISGKTTRLTLSDSWEPHLVDKHDAADPEVGLKTMIANLASIRKTAVLAESERLTLAQRPVERPIGRKADPGVLDSESETRIELDGVIDGLAPGRWIIVSGERLDTAGTRGVVASELAMIDNVEQQPDAGAGGTAYSVLVLAPEGLAYEYVRDTVKIYGNVVKSNNGETRAEILGRGDASQPLQTFALHQAPLTFVAAPTVAGVVSTLAVRVNDVLWHEVETLNGAAPDARVYVTRTADDGKVSVIGGTGTTGARLPTGIDNVRAIYRSGIGREANVRAGQIATAISRPLGIRDVVNPLPASGGADPEARDDARRNIPVSIQALGRIVSVQNYADFARTFAGISKASAVAMSDGKRRFVHLTIGGDRDIEIDIHSDLYRNLTDAIRKYGDPYQPFRVEMREKIVVAGAARVRVKPDYLWTSVGPAVRAALVEALSYDGREFAQVVFPAEIIAVIQSVPGVDYVDLDAVGGIKSTDLIKLPAADPAAPAVGAAAAGAPPVQLPSIRGVHPIVPLLAHHGHGRLIAAQIAYLPAELAELFVLTEITNV